MGEMGCVVSVKRCVLLQKYMECVIWVKRYMCYMGETVYFKYVLYG